MQPTIIPQQDIINALKVVCNKYGIPFGKKIECLFRNETAHFTSSNFGKTLSPGMEVAQVNNKWIDKIPYGWGSMLGYWSEFPNYAPSGTFDQVENTSALLNSRGVRRFIVFPNIEASMMSVAHLISSRGGDPGTWFSTNVTSQQKYDAILNTIIPHFINDNIK